MTGCNITGDRGYTQVELVQELLENELTYIGTLNRACAKKHLPPEMLEGHPRPHKDSKFVFTNGMSAVSHMDKKGKPPVIVLSSLHHDDEIEHNEGRKKPVMIVDTTEQRQALTSLIRWCGTTA